MLFLSDVSEMRILRDVYVEFRVRNVYQNRATLCLVRSFCEKTMIVKEYIISEENLDEIIFK